MIASLAVALATAVAITSAATVQTFAPPAACPTCTSGNYTGQNNGSLPVQNRVKGKSYSRFTQIWLENTDFAAAQASQTFQQLAAEGILLTNYNGVTHPSEPNYVASIAGDFFGMGDDNFYALPKNVSTMVDLLEAKNISWATYQENQPYIGFQGDYSQTDYLNASSTVPYTYYKRKHNPFIIADSIASVPERMNRIRNFNDFAVDVNASALPSYVYITPNLVNDAHDTDVTFVSAWLEYFLVPLLQNPNFNDNETLILLTFDENESYTAQNTVYTVLLGGAVSAYKGTTDNTFYTHYSGMSSVQHNWGLGSLGRQDTNMTVAQVFQFQANMTGYQNVAPTQDPLTNLTGIFPGVCNPAMWVPVTAPNMSAIGAGNGSVFTYSITSNVSLANFPAMNLTALGMTDPIAVPPNYTATYGNLNATNTSSGAMGSASPSSTGGTSTSTSGAEGRVAVLGAGVVALMLVASGALLI